MARILLAEDDESMRKFLVMALEKAGHDVADSGDGAEALALLKEAGKDAYDLLLADIIMPGMDGIELSQQATEIAPDIKVMFITGFAAVAMSNTENTPENSRILSKPFHLKELVDQVDDLLAA